MKYLKTYEQTRDILYTLKTNAVSTADSKGMITYRHNVNIIKSDYKLNPTNPGELVLSIEGTPGSWYISTLLESEGRYENIISINGSWICINRQEIMKELINILPDLEIILATNKYNL